MYTWTSPDGKTKNQIDYFLVKSRWRSSIRNVHTLPGADCGSDHQLVVAKFKLKLKAARKTKPQARLSVGDRQLFRKALEKDKSHWFGHNPHNNSVEDDWCKAKMVLLEAIKTSTPSNSTNVKRQHWMTDKTLALVEERRQLKASGGSQQAQNLLTAQVQAACRKDKNMFLQNIICKEVESHAEKYETRDLHAKIRLITKKGESKAWAVEDLGGNVVTNLEDVLETWKVYCQSLFLDPDAHNSTIPDIGELNMEPDILKEEVEAAIQHLKSGKAIGNDKIPIEIVKCSGEYGVELFHKVCNNIWQAGVWPQEWTHSIFVPLHKKGSTKKCEGV
ncbi:uncharacterized protein LOC125226743 [Leguminivora glycinivorella]|uniref:uncharacterized protein LOC125226743 n=1 Tax=Leguminivora glycinivorella TaxID=1035111 RepID=UPI00200EACFA|nr:uncharacterized protein LOC125226743 [Leguminivora glycinivorella]